MSRRLKERSAWNKAGRVRDGSWRVQGPRRTDLVSGDFSVYLIRQVGGYQSTPDPFDDGRWYGFECGPECCG